MSFFSARLFTKRFIQSFRSSGTARVLLGASLATCGLLISKPITLDDKIKELTNSIAVDNAVDPFPINLKYSTDYTVLGTGVRSVTFVSFKVYALGIYAAVQDLNKIPTVLDSNFLSSAFIDTDSTKSHRENVFKALNDKEKSKVLVSNLLDSNIRLVARITPIRNTDFNHLRDGLVKSILAAKVQDETLDKGLQQLKEAFLRKGSVAKNSNLVLERLGDGQLQLYFENTKTGELETLGRVQEPIVSKVLFLQYLSGGLSPSTRESCIEKISQLV
ncbi:unnamed protein product [Cyberlindnera jadinii]|uniref:Altered inheritance of mitochondria protein 18, mitochondrial n=1 Tax=Cyberlindnera jadinii (strain ATCC 18201 / CBS 1600 / BCRC 20928 / JCM 3617 / NBRC 0987 / NRRL Y-1542) TaxID=983966 RepID=A0A0H5C2K9_CYBJN|nr:chalcone isomerase [Cyberlindnera jadinii NRRL Y-1542]ODV72903.1 chalcone isomerase [Cyberlindnera jadinii NRRL Y-1542]CEP22083.1 unnamed protein product [Cyberlindnera jadinii]